MIKQKKKEMNQLKPILHVRKAQLDQEAAVLEEIRRTKLQALTELKKYQDMYMRGVEDLNRLRQDGDIDRLPTMESSLDYVKSQWYQSLKKVKGIEDQERAQVENVVVARKNLTSAEALNERLALDLLTLYKQSEQKENDEIAVQQFVRKGQS